MAAIAILIVDVPPRSLLRIEPKLGITLAALSRATETPNEQNDREAPESIGSNEHLMDLEDFYFEFTAASTMLSITSLMRLPVTLRLLVRIENASFSPLAVTAYPESVFTPPSDPVLP